MYTRSLLQVAIVVGGGNFFRGASWVGASGLDRASADQIGYIFYELYHLFRFGLARCLNGVNA